MVDINSPIVKEFLIESFESLSNISEELTKFEKNSNDVELLNSIYRKVHTLKGSASFLGLKKLQQINHFSENILDQIREKKIEICAQVTDILLDSFDACLEVLKSIESTGSEGNEAYSTLLEKLKSLDEQGLPLSPSSSNIKVGGLNTISEVIPQKIKFPKESDKVEALSELEVERVEVENIESNSNISLMNIRDKVQEIKDNIDLAKKHKEEQLNKKTKQTATSSSGNLVDSVVRVNVALLDKIMNVVGELVLNRNQILQFANADDSPDLSRLAHQLNAITTELQTDIMTTRMQPVGSVLTKFERVVRDLARQQGKNIKLNITGKDTELDKTLLEAIRDPLTHLIRNSADHGVEVPQKRIDAGKNEQGTISIKAYHEGGQVTIEISDDGNGIDPEKILKKALSKNIISPDRASSLTKKQVLGLIFTPGFSTAEAVTNISGRGVGMDVVKSNIEKIGGSVDVSSELGEGTVFKLKIPLTLAIVPALVVQSSEETFAIPQVNLVELVRIENDDEGQIETIHDSEFFRLRGDLIPIFRLDECLSFEKNEKEQDDINIAILSAEGSIYGLVVDEVLDTEEIVVKPLSRELKDISIYGGATIMGDGSVALIVDALGFYNHMGKISQGKKLISATSSSSEEKIVAYNDEVLLILLNDGREYGIPLAIVHRLEEFKRSQIEWSGGQALVRYRNSSMPLVSFEKSLSLIDTSVLDLDIEDIPVVVINVRGTQVGFVVNEIKDIAINHSKISTDTSDRDGFVGTAFINDKTVTILDLFSIVDSLPYKIKKEESLSKGKVLIVEDSELFLRIQKEVFQESGYFVETALNGKEALDKLTPDLIAIISDIDMPVMNGWELVKKIRSNQTFGKIPMVAVSSVATRRQDEILNAGFDFCFDKQNNKEAITIVDQLVR